MFKFPRSEETYCEKWFAVDQTYEFKDSSTCDIEIKSGVSEFCVMSGIKYFDHCSVSVTFHVS